MSDEHAPQVAHILAAFQNAKNHTLTTAEVAEMGGFQYQARLKALVDLGHRIYCGKRVPHTNLYFYRWFGQWSLDEVRAKAAFERAHGKPGFWMGSPKQTFSMWCEDSK